MSGAYQTARKLISSEVDSISPDDQSLSGLSLQYQEVVTCLLKSYNLIAVDLMSTKHGSMLVSELLIPIIVQSTNNPAFLPLQKD